MKITSYPIPEQTSILTNAFWDKITNRLFAVDLFGQIAISFRHSDKKFHALKIDGVNNPAIFLPLNDTIDQYLFSSDNEAFIGTWDGESDSVQKGDTVFTVPPDSNIDSVTVGPNGKLYIGNFGSEYCLESARFSLFGLTDTNDLAQYGDGLVTSVGGVILRYEQTYYHMDSCLKKLSAFKVNQDGSLCKLYVNMSIFKQAKLLYVNDNFGNYKNSYLPAQYSTKLHDLSSFLLELADKRHVMDLDFPGITPVGLTADTNGFLYCGIYGGAYIAKIDPRQDERQIA